MFPGDSSEEHRNKSSGASSAHMQRTASDARSAGGDRRIGAFAQQEQDNAHMAESIGYLMRLCLMAVAGYRTKISHSEIPTGTALDRPQVVSRSPKVLKLNGVAGTSSASREIAAFQVAAVDSFGRGKGNVKIPSDLQGVGSPSISYLKSPAASNAAGKPTANAAFTGAGGSGDPQNLCVQCIYLPRGEEVELLWLETCKIYASLSHSPDTVVSTMATQSLLTILRAGMSGTFPDLIILKALGELVSRLQLGFSATVARTANVDTPGQDANSIAYNIAHAVSVSQRSCNVVFEVVVAQIKAARDLDEFHTIWVRFISLVASNAHAAVPKGQHWWHDEMCDMLEALLRLLRLPATASAPKTSPRLNAVEVTAPTAKTTQQPTQQSANSGGGGYFGILGWIVAPLVAATDGPDVVRRATASAPVPSTTVESTGRSEFMSPGNNSNDAVIEPSDGYLLRISWQQICTAYPAFPASLQARDPKLLHRISTALLLPERYFQKNVYTERVNSAELVLPLEDATSRRKNVQRLPESSHQSVAVLPEDHTHPKEDTVLPSEMEIAEASSDVANPPEVINTSTLIADGPSTHTEERVTAPQKTPHDIRTHAQQTPPEMPPLVVSSVATSSPLEMDTITLTSVDRSGATLTSSCTPVRQAHQHAQLQEEMPGTPLADESMSMILPTPVQTPSGEQEGDHVSAAGLSPSMFGSARPMPFVRDLTPIFASAEVERRNASTSIQAAPSAGKTGDNVVRRLEVGSPAAGPWKTYPLQMPGTQGTPQAHQEPPQQPQQMCPSPAAPHRAPQSTAAHPQAGKAIPTRVAAKPLSSRVQIV